uniref:Uncharacterized protein n=1 Tax=Clytia hemisphaerica TaxID=252671 RepID=A0A7M5X9V1_9CNID
RIKIQVDKRKAMLAQYSTKNASEILKRISTTVISHTYENVREELGTTERPLTEKELSKRRKFATAIIVCFSLAFVGIFVFVIYNHFKVKWNEFSKQEREEGEYFVEIADPNGKDYQHRNGKHGSVNA